MDIRPLHTEEDHAWALRELETLWSQAQPGTPDGDRFEILATLVESYERQHVPVEPADPIDAIRFAWSKRASRRRICSWSSRPEPASRR